MSVNCWHDYVWRLKGRGGVKYDLADGSASLQPGPQIRHSANGFAHFLPSTSIPLYNLAMCGTDNRSGRQASVLTAVGNRTLHLSTPSVATAAGLAARTLYGLPPETRDAERRDSC
jgi:hypothetical protein